MQWDKQTEHEADGHIARKLCEWRQAHAQQVTGESTSANTAPKRPPGLTAAAEIMVESLAAFVAQDLQAARRKAESPEELMLLYALAAVGAAEHHAVFFRVEGYDRGIDQRDAFRILIIEPQGQIGEHRVDFLLEMSWIYPTYGKRQEVWESVYLVIECDEHGADDKTPEQARRDRMLESCGYPVFRYSRSEIWDDPMACAAQAFAYMEKEMKGLIRSRDSASRGEQPPR